MIAVDGLMLGDLGVAKAIGLLLGGEQFDILTQRALITFERENVIGFLVEDFLGDIALAAHGVDGDDGAFDHQHVEKGRDGDGGARTSLASAAISAVFFALALRHPSTDSGGQCGRKCFEVTIISMQPAPGAHQGGTRGH